MKSFPYTLREKIRKDFTSVSKMKRSPYDRIYSLLVSHPFFNLPPPHPPSSGLNFKIRFDSAIHLDTNFPFLGIVVTYYVTSL